MVVFSSNTRGLFSGFNTVPAAPGVMDYVTISTTGNAADFGDLTVSRYGVGGASSTTRGLFAGGVSSNVIDYVTISSTGNATDFGDLTVARYYPSGVSNTLRAVFAGGESPYQNVMDYVTIASTSNASDFWRFNIRTSRYGTCIKRTWRVSRWLDQQHLNIL